MQVNCKNTAVSNATAGCPQHNLDVLTSAEWYAGLEAQNAYDPAIYAQIATVAIKAQLNKALRNKGSGEQLPKILQGLQNLIVSLLTQWEVTFWGMWTQLCRS